jgi:tRNA (guanine37-N1)-methyltransferase
MFSLYFPKWFDVRIVNIRNFARGAHRSTDDRPYGGGDGMVMRPGPISRSLESIDRVRGRSHVILLSPQGERFDQETAWELSRWNQIVLICGRYEGVDERIRLTCIERELSINLEDSFEDGLLEYPQYTRPRVFQGQEVPPVLLSGDHEKIRMWRRAESLKRTLERRPDLLQKARLTPEDKSILARLKREFRN